MAGQRTFSKSFLFYFAFIEVFTATTFSSERWPILVCTSGLLEAVECRSGRRWKGRKQNISSIPAAATLDNTNLTIK